MDYKITLNEQDQTRCKELANARFKSNRKSGIKNKRIGNQSDEFTDLQGIGGEFAFCRLFGLDPDETIHPRSSKTDTGDVHFADGTIVDVKTTHYKHGRLLVVPWKVDESTDYYGLMVGTFPTFEFKGFITRQEMLQERRLTDLGHGLTYAARQDELDREI